MNAAFRTQIGLISLPLYLLITLAIGWMARRGSRSSDAYLNASRSLPLPIVTAAYLAANCGALEVVGLSAMAAQYGVQAFQFYWIGAIPAMIFLSIWMMPVYLRSGIRTMPEYLELRYGPSVRLLNACVLAVTMLLLAGISLYAMAQVLDVVMGFSFQASVIISAGVVLVYVLLGGIKATIYNEVFQLLVMVVGLAPLAIRSMRLNPSILHIEGGISYHLWSSMPAASTSAPFDGVGVVFGLGLILSFGYWCTDFVLMQRAFTARTEKEARQVPLWAGFGKLIFSLIVVLPGMVAVRYLPQLGRAQRFDQALPALMTVLYGPAMLGLGLTALAASLMSGLAANVSSFATLWTEDIYRSRLYRNKPDGHYLLIGRLSALFAVVVSALASYLNFFFDNLMDHVQLIFSIFGSPFWAIFLLGLLTRRTTARGAMIGFFAGSGVSILHCLAYTHALLSYGSPMSANFYAAIYGFGTAAAIGWLSSDGANSASALTVDFRWCSESGNRRIWLLAAVLLIACIALNVHWR